MLSGGGGCRLLTWLFFLLLFAIVVQTGNAAAVPESLPTRVDPLGIEFD
jgi:hypothetical protein